MPLLYMAWSEGELPALDDPSPTLLYARLSSMRQSIPALVARLDALADRGIALTGFQESTTSWVGPIILSWPLAPVVVD